MNNYMIFFRWSKWLSLIMIGIVNSICTTVHAQQLNTDDYMVMPKGTVTTLAYAGQRSSQLLASVSFSEKWEVFAGVTLNWEKYAANKTNSFQTVLQFKRKLYVNKDNTAGASVMFGTGNFPGYLSREQKVESFRNFFCFIPVSFAVVPQKMQWDVNAGAQYNLPARKTVGVNGQWSGTYSTRLWYYNVIPKATVVAEVFGVYGNVFSTPEYKAGIRYEASDILKVLGSYGGDFKGRMGAGFELGVMIFSPTFFNKKS